MSLKVKTYFWLIGFPIFSLAFLGGCYGATYKYAGTWLWFILGYCEVVTAFACGVAWVVGVLYYDLKGGFQ